MIAPIVLAAGLGTRMGRLKPLLRIEDRPALAIVLDTLQQALLDPPIVVLGHRHEEIRGSVDLSHCTLVVNPEPSRGLASSFRLGLDATAPGAMGVLVMLVDMPLVRLETVRAVIGLAELGAAIAAPTYNGQRGFPVFFRQDQLEELRESLVGDTGGRAYIDTHTSSLQLIPVDDPGCVRDFDVPSDIEELKGVQPCTISEQPMKWS